MTRSVLFVALLLMSGLGRAAGWTNDLTASYSFVEGSTDLVVIGTSDGVVNTPGSVLNAWMFIADSEIRRNRAYSTILTAIAAGGRSHRYRCRVPCLREVRGL